MTDLVPPPRPPDAAPRRRVDPWLIGFAIAAAAILGLFIYTSGDSSPRLPSPILPPPVGEEAILDSARNLTREQEGLSLRPYHPAPESGVSIGHGYDMRERTPERVRADLAAVDPPIRSEWITALSLAAGITGDEARAFADEHGVIFLTLEQADSLFDVTYREEADLAREFATNPDDFARLGVTYEPVDDWDALDPAIRGIVIDLKFRGDYRPWWPGQRPLQNAVVANDPQGVLDALADQSAFPDDLVGSERFEARIEWLAWVLGE